MKKPGRPPLAAGQQSVSVHLKISSDDYDGAYAMAVAYGISVPELVRNALGVELMISTEPSLTTRKAFRIVRARRDAEQAKIRDEQIASMSEGHARRARRLRAGFVEPVRRSVVFERANGICGICGESVCRDDKWHIDHVVPLAKGGVHSYDNVQLAHAACNLAKHAKLPNGGSPV